jgi:hypothetical protein
VELEGLKLLVKMTEDEMWTMNEVKLEEKIPC